MCRARRRMPRSGNADNAAHAGGMMFHHVAVKQPQTGIVGDEDKVGDLARGHQIGVTQDIPAGLAEFARIHPEMMPMKMHRMFPARVVADP